MKAWYLVGKGDPRKAFELRDLKLERPKEDELRLKVEGFGINYADVMATKGLYQDAPARPCIIGYEVVGRIEEMGTNAGDFAIGDRVVAFTRFGGYATHINVRALATARIPDDLSITKATALATQFCTAWFSAEYVTRLHEGDRVLIQAAAGGVGTALIQLAKLKNCIIFGTAGSDEKIELIKKLGVHHAINYRNQDFFEEVKKINGEDQRLDLVFDSIGGKAFKQGMKLLGAGGRIVGIGAAARKGGLSDLPFILNWGFYSPAFLLMPSRSIIGVNMLRIADNKPMILKKCLDVVTKLQREGRIDPVEGKSFDAAELPAAIEYVATRKSVGKVALKW